jgi:hypothetical protein
VYMYTKNEKTIIRICEFFKKKSFSILCERLTFTRNNDKNFMKYSYVAMKILIAYAIRGAQWPSVSALSVRSRKLATFSKVRWVIKIYYLELLHASDGTLSRWSRLHLQSIAPAPVSRRVDIRQETGHKNNCQDLYHNTSDPPRLRKGAMLIVKCFSTIAYRLPREMGYLTLKEFFKSDQ